MTTPASSSSMVTAQLVNQISDIAAAVNNAGAISGTQPLGGLKGTVQAVHLTATPPVVDLTLSGSSTLVPGVIFSDSYTPFVGDVCWVVEQNNTIFALGQAAAGGSDAANGWISSTTTPAAITLGSGVTNSAHGGGPVEARLKMESGSIKCELRGNAGVGGGGNIVQLPAGYRPSVQRTFLAASDINSMMVKLDVNPSTGWISATTPNYNTSNASPGTSGSSDSYSGGTGGASDSYGGTTGGASAGTAHDHGYSGGTSGHSHGYSGSTSGHSHTVTSHNHNINQTPSWISLDGCSFYL